MRRRIGALSEEMVGSIVEQEEFINGTDVSRADADQQAKHSELQKCLKHIRNLMNKARVTQDAQEARALQDEMTKSAADLESLFRYERNIIFYNAGVQLGYDNDTSRWFTDYMTYVSDMTSLPSTIRRIRQASRETAPPKSEEE